MGREEQKIAPDITSGQMGIAGGKERRKGADKEKRGEKDINLWEFMRARGKANPQIY